MASYLVHYIAKDAGRDYRGFENTLRSLGAAPLTEELWLVESDAGLQELTETLFSDRPPSDRFLLVELTAAPAWSAANLVGDPRAAFSAIASGRNPGDGRRSVKVYRPGQPPSQVAARRGSAPA